MKAQINISSNTKIEVNLNAPIKISIPIKKGGQNPNCYWAEPVKFETIKADGFIGSVAEGGSVNYQKLQITPHGNGTHTEGFGHITNSGKTINHLLKQFHFYAKLISLTPTVTKNGDQVVNFTKNIEKLDWKNTKALIIRTLPNKSDKLTKQYSGTNPPYVSSSLIEFIVKKGIEHLLIDLPSVDKEVDGGELLSHNAFWCLPKQPRIYSTITELIYVPNEVKDGNYLLNLQVIDLEMDATPSQPLLYKIDKIIPISSK